MTQEATHIEVPNFEAITDDIYTETIARKISTVHGMKYKMNIAELNCRNDTKRLVRPKKKVKCKISHRVLAQKRFTKCHGQNTTPNQIK